MPTLNATPSDQPAGEERWVPLKGKWVCFVVGPDAIWLKKGDRWEENTGSSREAIERVFEDYEQNGLKYFLPHGPEKDGGRDFLNDWKHGIVVLTAMNRAGKSAHGTNFSLLRTHKCDPEWNIFKYNGVVCPEYRGPRKLVISSYQWGNVEEVWQEYRRWCPRYLLGPYAPAYGKYRGETGSAKDLSFASGKTQRLRLKDGSEYLFLCDAQRQGAWEGKRWDDHHVDEQRDRDKWIGYLRGTANTKGLVQAAFTLTPHVMKDRPDTGLSGWFCREILSGEYTFGKSVGRYTLGSANDVPDAVLSPERKQELHRQWVIEPTKNQDEDTLRMAQARYWGKPEPGGGCVIENFDPATHVIPVYERKHPVICDATRYRGVDHGLGRPCACLWADIFPWGDLVFYREYYQRGKTVPYHAKHIVEMSGNTMIKTGMYSDESTIAPYPVFTEQFKGERYDSSVLDGRDFNKPSQERETTLGELYNACGLYCSAACGTHNKKQDGSGMIPQIIRMFAKEADRPHVMWQFWKRKVITDEQYQAWLNARGGDYKNGAHIYFMRSLSWTQREIRLWRNDPETGQPISEDDHLMSAMKYIVGENPVYRGQNWRDDVEEWGTPARGERKYTGY